MKIVIVDYGSGNLRSVQNGLTRAGFPSVISDRPSVIDDASHVIVPGVGAFPDCMKHLDALGLLAPITDAIAKGKPYLGICLGYQILFTEGTEFGSHPGLDVVPGRVVRFPAGALTVPHMGWNRVRIQTPAPCFSDIPDEAYFYFVHAYYPVPTDPSWVAATTEYGVTFPAAIARNNVFACQFHPEKSQALGVQLLGNFARMR